MSTPRKRFRVVLLLALLALAAIATPAQGATWSNVPTLAPEGFSESTLSDVSCASPSFCIAVGIADDGIEENGAPSNGGAFSEIWDGASWRSVPTADRAGAGGALLSVSCVSPSFCVAVGATHSTGRYAVGKGGFYGQARALVEIWDGTAWKVASPPAGALFHSGLNGVDCTGASFCVAVGAHSPNGRTSDDALVETWDGRAWKVRATPFVARHGSPLFGVSCASADSCMAVGEYNANQLNGVGEGEALAEHWNGRRWSIGHPPVGRLYFPDLKEVACPSRSLCIAIGLYATSQNSTAPGPLVERWRSGHWRRVTAGLPKMSSLFGIACPGMNRCVAVGRLDSAFWLESDRPKPLLLNWAGSRWTREKTPLVPSTRSEEPNAVLLGPSLFGISCPAAGGCTAVGSQPSGDVSSPLVLSTATSFAEPTPALPAPRISAAPGTTTTSRTARLEFGSSSAGATFECRLTGDGVGAALSGWASCESPKTYTHLPPGTKRFSVRAVLGTERSAATTREWTVLEPGAPQPVVLPVVGDHANFHATCPLGERCHERVVVQAGGKELAHGTYSVAAHADRAVQIALTGAGRAALAHRGQVAATLVLENLHTHRRATVAVLLVRR